VYCQLGETREKVKDRKDRAAAEGVEDLIDAGYRNLRDLGDFIQFLVVDRDPNASGFLWNAHEGAGPGRCGVLDETGGEIRVKDGVHLLGEYRIESVWSRLYRLSPGGDLNFKRSYGARSVIEFG
jgi:hypothetical protein